MGKVGSGQVIGAKSAVTTSYCVARKLQETKRQFLKMIQTIIDQSHYSIHSQKYLKRQQAFNLLNILTQTTFYTKTNLASEKVTQQFMHS